MKLNNLTSKWLDPLWHLALTTLISLLTALIGFRSAEFSRETLITFIAYYLILVIMAIMFRQRARLTDSRTRQFLQFSFFLLGFVLMVTGFLGMLNGDIYMIAMFLFMLFLPGMATLRAGFYFNKNGE